MIASCGVFVYQGGAEMAESMRRVSGLSGSHWAVAEAGAKECRPPAPL